MATLLVGRCIEFRIMPFSFAESYEYCKQLGKEQAAEVLFIDYINWGGMPLRFTFNREGDIKKYIDQTYQGILDKDIITDRSKINRQNFEKIATYVMANAGKEFSAKNIGSYFENLNEEQIDKKTIYRYLDLWFIRGNIFGTDPGGGYKRRSVCSDIARYIYQKNRDIAR